MFGRKLKTKEEKEFWNQAYEIGMKNGWCSGEFDREDGNFIVEEDRLNKNSAMVIDDLETLKEFFRAGNWCLGTAVIYKSICFIEQVNGGDEWLTMKLFSDGKVRSFESMTLGPEARDYQGEMDYSYLDHDRRSKDGKAKAAEFYKHNFRKDIEAVQNAKVFESKRYPSKQVVIYASELQDYKNEKIIAE